VEELKLMLREFAEERDWDQFHSPKNLAMALSVEVGEIVECFQWLTEEESRRLDDEALSRVSKEIGDVLIYLVRLADKLEVDPVKAAKEKLDINREKYPKELVKGKSKKYSEY